MNSTGIIKESIEKIYNPIEAKGGLDPENIDSVRLYAPQSFRKQERAVTWTIMLIF